ncbi:MAG: hypothetical protein M3P27_06730 [Acidobacteriota bacterium]|nr:hypothetical protein [Acidobacteriota bacterium]
MKRLLYAIAMTLAFAGFMALQGQTKHSRHNDWGRNNISTNNDEAAPGDACDDHFNVTFDGRDAFTAEEARTLKPSEFAGGLDVRAPQNGGVLVRGWDKNEVLVKACKAVAAYEEGEAKGLLSELKLVVSGNQIRVTGPESTDDRRSVVHFLINVPRNIKLTMDAHNGPLTARDVFGTISATTVNGPVSIYRCSGEITAEATNGPVSVTRSSGNIRVRTQNGPLDIELNGSEWSGPGLDASAQNGPIKLRIPPNYKSGVEVSSRGHSPFHCATDACSGAHKDWDDSNKSVHLGGQTTVVRMSTVNGPVSIVSTMQ